jgi:hypothetical protein
MSDTQIMKPLDGDNEALTESQVIALRDVPRSVQKEPEAMGDQVSVIGETLHFKGELSAGEDLVKARSTRANAA